ncbi:unnamed protein product [Notodromas monacha]|uniref:Uncharacterized protein n=1 Tax=Notodromas monacha TaxID=399045 RepID=A0A7R9BII2_9CRUS|nr:unnamed protein product [Notodromas monacha]CAG0914748.1 unnamed protein product [Notodromas monacha]
MAENARVIFHVSSGEVWVHSNGKTARAVDSNGQAATWPPDSLSNLITGIVVEPTLEGEFKIDAVICDVQPLLPSGGDSDAWSTQKFEFQQAKSITNPGEYLDACSLGRFLLLYKKRVYDFRSVHDFFRNEISIGTRINWRPFLEAEEAQGTLSALKIAELDIDDETENFRIPCESSQEIKLVSDGTQTSTEHFLAISKAVETSLSAMNIQAAKTGLLAGAGENYVSLSTRSDFRPVSRSLAGQTQESSSSIQQVSSRRLLLSLHLKPPIENGCKFLIRELCDRYCECTRQKRHQTRAMTPVPWPRTKPKDTSRTSVIYYVTPDETLSPQTSLETKIPSSAEDQVTVKDETTISLMPEAETCSDSGVKSGSHLCCQTLETHSGSHICCQTGTDTESFKIPAQPQRSDSVSAAFGFTSVADHFTGSTLRSQPKIEKRVSIISQPEKTGPARNILRPTVSDPCLDNNATNLWAALAREAGSGRSTSDSISRHQMNTKGYSTDCDNCSRHRHSSVRQRGAQTRFCNLTDECMNDVFGPEKKFDVQNITHIPMPVIVSTDKEAAIALSRLSQHYAKSLEYFINEKTLQEDKETSTLDSAKSRPSFYTPRDENLNFEQETVEPIQDDTFIGFVLYSLFLFIVAAIITFLIWHIFEEHADRTVVEEAVGKAAEPIVKTITRKVKAQHETL